MKSQLSLSPHTALQQGNVVEVRFKGELLMTICGDDGPGVRIISKFMLKPHDKSSGLLSVLEIKLAGAE